ncbi:abscisic acid receptor PYL8 [Gossypium raimondii]|uniref:Uncharacterized protein n=1 Tax=Gossypium raimondii TaxID=29730 RepID=A0A0D2QX39_GOSRA|nr:abscisic acid receptor PYL8 [Gossypium raimondii]KJB24228.1 hypothetical protein B456_004G133900 [Gossypium raimondii]KJB24229.1 hypothetical protein B456_004G133900 [Gossypium raimondii]
MVTKDHVTMNGNGNSNWFSKMEEEFFKRHHKCDVTRNQYNSSLVKLIKAIAHLVWPVLRRFDQLQKNKASVSRCVVCRPQLALKG